MNSFKPYVLAMFCTPYQQKPITEKGYTFIGHWKATVAAILIENSFILFYCMLKTGKDLLVDKTS